ncbi:hypothetical protein A3H66_00555 [Candidatus Falkowbacteria bacterium RIFCSPLOWO2_02_FULL_45_21]|uniref:Uncharacterized protein n=1 Tax=Candidatus Falkowbacteria bacterium RIFCSPLOWO2_02_FULL_45_21 TaxID=1797989 RepID=A0A1F5SBX4_9BACT|nr:MAG: hypothetical protein A3H66_00555 [Candidatus Falkowbacteria bacterium RIFCSPLOWO2_02_FULL_45_21]
MLRKKSGYILQTGIALGVEFKCGAHDLRNFLINDDSFIYSVVKVADRSERGIFAALHFLV